MHKTKIKKCLAKDEIGLNDSMQRKKFWEIASAHARDKYADKTKSHKRTEKYIVHVEHGREF